MLESGEVSIPVSTLTTAAAAARLNDPVMFGCYQGGRGRGRERETTETESH